MQRLSGLVQANSLDTNSFRKLELHPDSEMEELTGSVTAPTMVLVGAGPVL